MAGVLGAGEVLRAGLDDRRQAWEFIRRFAAEWAAPLAPGDGVSRDAWRAAEQNIGAGLPAALREAYLLFGRRPDLTARQDRLVPAHELGLDDTGTVVFRVENQYCAEWGVVAADLAGVDPPVYVRDRNLGGGWEPFLARVSVACVETVLSEVLLGAGRLGNACELPGELITTVESVYEQMALPEYPLWCDRSIMVRWFFAPGKLLRMDGRGSYCWLFVRGRTLADLETICATIPGPWVSRQGTIEISDPPHVTLCKQARPPVPRRRLDGLAALSRPAG